ncbi:Homeodomain-like protein, partial [Thelonectria olida]
MTSNLRTFGTIISGNRQSGQEIDPETRSAIFAAVDLGEKKSDVARDFGVSPSAVTRIIQRFEQTQSVHSQPRSGRPKSLSPRDKRAIVRKVHQNNDITRGELVYELQLPVSVTTIRRALNEINLRK